MTAAPALALFEYPKPKNLGPLVIAVRGVPAPQGSKHAWIKWALPKCSACGQLRFVRMIMRESSANELRRWRRQVAQAAAAKVAAAPVQFPLEGPLGLRMVFTLQRPRNQYLVRKHETVLRDDAPRYPSGKPDVSKLVRAVEDALTGIVWKDDAQVCEYRRLGKFWAGEDPAGTGLAGPGVVIEIWKMR